MAKNAIIIFVRNPVLGQVKTRLAKTIGAEAALKVYKILLLHTDIICKDLDCDKYLFYVDEINADDSWNNRIYKKQLQSPGNLGKRMSAAFDLVLKNGCNKVLIIGSDCYELSRQLIENAFDRLEQTDIVLGPAVDGGYYLLGMKKHQPALFENILWSTSSVLSQTINTCNKYQQSYFLLPVLNDVDEEKDINFDY